MHEGSGRPKVSVVIPAFNAAATLAELIDETLQTLETNYRDYELIVVDDGSRDDTWTIITDAAAASPRLIGLRFARNFGQTPALCAGIDAASGDVVVTMDADFDTLPDEIPKLVDAVVSGAAVANGVRSGRGLQRSLPSQVFNRRMRKAGVGFADIGCGLVAMRNDVAREVLEHGEFRRGFRFKLLLGALTPDIAEVPVRSGPHSSSSYRMADLFSAGLEAELAQRRTVFLGVAALGGAGAACAALIAMVAAVVAVVGGDGSWWMVAAWGSLVALLATLIALVAIVGNLVLRGAFHQATPFFRIGDSVNDSGQAE